MFIRMVDTIYINGYDWKSTRKYPLNKSKVMGNLEIEASVLSGDVSAKFQTGVIYNICLSMWPLTSGLISELDWCLSSIH